MKKIYLIGTSGFPNFGDEIILRNWVRYLSKSKEQYEIWIDCPQPSFVACLLNEFPINIKTTNALWKLCCETHFDNTIQFVSQIDHWVKYLGTPKLDLQLLNLRDVDIFHIIGGGYINSIWKHHIGLLQACVSYKKHFNTNAKLVMTGGGLLPLAENSGILQLLLSDFDICESRDFNISDFLDNIQAGCDDAFLDLNFEFRRAEYIDDAPDIAVCLQKDLASDKLFEKNIRNLRHRLIKYSNQGKSIAYIEAIPGLDRVAFDYLSQSVNEMKFYPALDIIQNGLPLKQGQYWITSRFHHHLIASSFGCMGEYISVKPDYYDQKHASLVYKISNWVQFPNTQPSENKRYISNDAIKLNIQHKQKIADSIYISEEQNKTIPHEDIL